MAEQYANNPIIDAYTDFQSEELDALIHSQHLVDILQEHTPLVSTLLSVPETFAVDASRLPVSITEYHHFPSRIDVSNLRLYLTQDPRSNLWTLSGNYQANGYSYSVESSASGMTVETQNYEGAELVYQTPAKACFELLSAFAASPDLIHEIQQLMAYDPNDMTPTMIRRLLQDIGSSLGTVTTTYEAQFEEPQRSQGNPREGRAAYITFTERESTASLAKSLKINIGADFGAGVTETIYEHIEQTTQDGKHPAIKQAYYRGQSDLPLSDFTMYRQLEKGPTPSSEVSDFTKRSIASLVMISLNRLS